MEKILLRIIWLLVILIGSFTRRYIPERFIYDYGFLFGCISLAVYQTGNLFKKGE